MQLVVTLRVAQVSLICILTSHDSEDSIRAGVGLTEHDVGGSKR